ncbi:probable indole-3-pyruvate monooxygenase YUCCA11 [Coffea arabica]|uniref:indole-3-pyruvate monooxygenase n=1 Tax=Coffea arabica TaxID=13443 RepID=A0A6P6UHZ2_COFAR|nr:probable indole-3-pyruvate monooxygenase YUCCA11 [Coffea arabica]
MKQETVVIIVGGGPAGLATSACLNVRGIPNIVLEREDCSASLWKKRTYGRLKLHLAKQFCQLPHLSFPSDAPTFVPKDGFIQYLDDYTSHFNINPIYCRLVESASFDVTDEKWLVLAKNALSGAIENYVAKFLVVATGENSQGLIPEISGLDSFGGVAMHSSHYDNGQNFCDKDVLVVGSGNSGMEIAYDLADWDAKTSIVIRSPEKTFNICVHVLTKEMVRFGMKLLKFIPCDLVDSTVVMLSKFLHGNLAKYGLERPDKGPFLLKNMTGQSPVIDVGTLKMIKSGKIQVLPAVKRVDGDYVEFSNGIKKNFDAKVFATGYKSTVRTWLKDETSLFNEDGMPQKSRPNHWKGDDGLYCAGFSSSGLFGISKDAMNIAEDINFMPGKEKN